MTSIKFVCLLLGLVLAILRNVSSTQLKETCTTAFGIPGKCIPADSCREISNKFEQHNRNFDNLSPYEVEYLVDSKCGKIDGVHYVCCNNTQSLTNQDGLDHLMQYKNTCGKFTKMFINNGKEINPGSRPWMALLKYRYSIDQSITFDCGATLISDLYVLTAAHCVNGLEKELIAVRLGEHNIQTDPDCFSYPTKTKCQPKVEDIGIKEFFVHEEYNRNMDMANDIALLRLIQPVTVRVNINIICLPLLDTIWKETDSEGSDFEVVGWGTTENNNTNVPMEAVVKIQKRNECRKQFRVNLKNSQLCAGHPTMDSCNGDSGGPLTKSVTYVDDNGTNRMVQFGIVSFGKSPCGQGSGVYTNVASFIPWITHKIANSL